MGLALSVLASISFLRSFLNQLIPPEIQRYLWAYTRRFSSEHTMVVKESHEGTANHLYDASVTYLGRKMSSSSLSVPERLTVGKNINMKVVTFGLDNNSKIVDTFDGVPMKWTCCISFHPKYHTESSRFYELTFHKQYSDMVKDKYLPYILDMAKRIKAQNKVVKFYTIRGGQGHGCWTSRTEAIKAGHPMTFDTLGMDDGVKEKVIEDLDTFVGAKDYYKKIGKVWKRGYLLYGPPGTGKSSLIAAMANYLNYDIYNMNLSVILSDSCLESLLLHMSNRSILVVEDIDCSIVLPSRQAENYEANHNPIPLPKVTLSGLLNAIDGQLSCCGDERIIVFSNNYKDRLDPALLRAGRMDMHIYLSYCTFSTFKQLAANYLEIWEHDLFHHIEKLIREVEVSPAEVSGELMKIKDPQTCLESLIRFLQSKQKSETKSLAPAHLASQGLKNNAGENNSDSLDKKDKQQAQSSCETTDSAANDLSNKDEVESPANSSSTLKANNYSVKTELAPILEDILSKHSDIAANSFLQSAQCHSSLLEIVCGIIKKLEATHEIKNLTQVELKSILRSIHGLESVRSRQAPDKDYLGPSQ